MNESAATPDDKSGEPQGVAAPPVAAPLDYATPRKSGASKRREMSIVELASLAAGVSAFLVFVIRLTGMASRDAQPGWVVAALLWSIGVVLLATSRFINDRHPTDRAWRRRSSVLCGVLFLLSLGSGACPHAQWISIGPARIAYSGKLCGNPDKSIPFLSFRRFSDQ